VRDDGRHAGCLTRGLQEQEQEEEEEEEEIEKTPNAMVNYQTL
jgi:hypothetical protein